MEVKTEDISKRLCMYLYCDLLQKPAKLCTDNIKNKDKDATKDKNVETFMIRVLMFCLYIELSL